MLQLNLAMFLQLQGLVLYTYFKPFEEGVENFLAISTQLEILITVHFALLSHLSGLNLEHGDDATIIGALLTAGVITITVLGLFIIVVAVCKANPHEPWVDAFKRTLPTFVAGEARYGDTKATQVRRRKGIKLGKPDGDASRRSRSSSDGADDDEGMDGHTHAGEYDAEQQGGNDSDGSTDLDFEPGLIMSDIRLTGANVNAVEEEKQVDEATALSLALSQKNEEIATLKAMTQE